ncbi:MAG: DNA primase [Bacillota bacterium]
MEQVRARTDIVEVVSGHVLLKKAGKNYLGLCPFHSEKTPSFTVSPEKQLFYCFGCQEGGDVFTFLEKKEGMSFREALEHLAEAAGVCLPEAEDPASRRRAALVEALELAAGFYRTTLQRSEAAGLARAYLERRGVRPEIIERFGLGYAPGEWDAMCLALRRKKVSEEVLLQAGLAGRRTTGGVYDRFRNRIMFPIRDVSGRVIGFGGRTLDDSGPKYLNSPETPVFRKGHCLYALNLAREAVRRLGRAVVVEGYMDVVASHQAGVENVVASLGTALTEEQARLVLRYVEEAVMAYDADAAGEAATLRGLDVFSAMGCRVKVATLPEGQDPDDIVRQGGKEALEAVLDQALPLVEYRLARSIKGVGTKTVEGKVKVSEEMVPVLGRIRNAVERSSYIRMVAARLGVEEAALGAEVNKHRAGRHKKVLDRHNRVDNAETGKKTGGDFAGERVELDLVRLMLQYPETIPMVREHLGDGFKDSRCGAIAKALYAVEGKRSTPPALLDMLSGEEGMLLTRISVESIEYTDPLKAVRDCLATLEKRKALARLNEIQQAIRSAEADGLLPDTRLLEEYQGIVRGLKGSA